MRRALLPLMLCAVCLAASGVLLGRPGAGPGAWARPTAVALRREVEAERYLNARQLRRVIVHYGDTKAARRARVQERQEQERLMRLSEEWWRFRIDIF